MKYQQVGFRPFKNKLCVLPVTDSIRPQLADYDQYQDIQSVMVYGYVDHEDGFCFEVISLSKDNESFYEENEVPSVCYESDEILEVDIEILDNFDLENHYFEKILQIQNNQDCASLKWTRELKYLDEYRDFHHIDDVRIYFSLENGATEELWARLEAMIGSDFKVCLLEEPSSSDHHRGQEIILHLLTKKDGKKVLSNVQVERGKDFKV